MRIVTSQGVRIVSLNEQTIVQDALHTLDDSYSLHWVVSHNDIADHWGRTL
jgi:hypothetical protein